MLRLYDNPLSGNCYKVRLLLAQLDRPYERVPVKLMHEEKRGEEIQRRNAAGRIPVLEWEDGRVLAESNAILYHLAEGTPLLPREPFARAGVLRWMFWEQNAPEPNIGVARYLIHITRTADRYPEIVENRLKGGVAALKVVERHLQEQPEGFLAGDYSIGDIAVYAYTHLAPDAGIDLEPFPALRAWFGRIEARPGYVPMLPRA